MRGNTRNLSGYLPESGRCTESVGVSAQIRVLCGKCRGIHLSQGDIQNVSVYQMIMPPSFMDYGNVVVEVSGVKKNSQL
jgi:hypothetical protein